MSRTLAVFGLLLLGIATPKPLSGESRQVVSVTTAASTAMVPFKIQVPGSVLTDLQDRLRKTRYPDAVEGAGWRYGFDLAYMKELVTYWRNRYDWRAQERRLNEFEQFKANIDGLDIHFIHRRSKVPNATPIILVHGWPSSFLEFTRVIERLTDPVRFGGHPDDAFHVVVPSLPGYGFSDKPRQSGIDPPAIAAMFVKLMARLGYTRYVAEGTDWGWPIASTMARVDATHAIGLFSAHCSTGPPPGAANPLEGVPDFEVARRKAYEAYWTDEEKGYSAIQFTRPQTLGFGLNDSPVGLAAWILEKFRAWSDVGGDVESKFTKDVLLTNVMIYWVTETAHSAARLYFESRHPVGRALPSALPPRGDDEPIKAPLGCMATPAGAGSSGYSPRKWLEARFNLKHFALVPRGGHFAALEEPELFAENLRAFRREIQAADASQTR